ncbi:leucine--tRNA ligase [Synechococcus sp. M16CYN]
MGHVRNYVITDVMARVQRMKGMAVLHPMGWDAFGLPAENAAIERNTDPSDWTNRNINQMRDQLDRLGLSIDWNREQTTCHSDYYRWTQWLFLRFLDSGLAYRKNATVNWDPVDQTVLANEQVDAEGRSWRSGALVEQRQLNQWFLRITDYAEPLLNDLNKLKGWPERVRTMQANWIGRSEGAEITFLVNDQIGQSITIFTTRPDTLAGASYVVLAPEHKLVDMLTTEDRRANVERFREQIARLSATERIRDDKPKRGEAIGASVTNPLNGEILPVWIADYVLVDYGTGAVMGVPAHDQRDIQFARIYNLPIRQVIDADGAKEAIDDGKAWTKPGTLINSNAFNDMTSTQAQAKVVGHGERAGWATGKVTYRLRDWLISRQRYWGCPIPVIHCPSCGVVPVLKEDLPVQLPRGIDLSSKGGSPLSLQADWVNVPCPRCGTAAKRETDTMDTFMCSSWYFLRFADPNNIEQPFSKEAVNRWLPVKQYVGGVEHAILHLLYARFFTKALKDSGLIDLDEPFEQLLTQGMVQGVTYRNQKTGKYIAPADVENPDDPHDPNTGDQLEVLFEKMSKSKHNGVNPAEVIDRYGADTTRMFILFKAPPEKDLEWDDNDVEGQFRFLQRLWRLVNAASVTVNSLAEVELPTDLTDEEIAVHRALHLAIEAVSEDLRSDIQLNTAISELMKFSNTIIAAGENALRPPVLQEALSGLIRLLAPFAPHLAEEFWSRLGGEGRVHHQSWPVVDPTALVRDSLTIVIQIKGKVRGTIQVPIDIDKETLEAMVLGSDVANKWLEGALPKRVITVPGKLVNLVT